LSRWPVSRKLGLALIALSAVLYAAILALPFVPADAAVLVALGALLAVCGEAAFWVGAGLVGRELILKYRRRLDPRRLVGRRQANSSDP